jgi:hypothetical protein
VSVALCAPQLMVGTTTGKDAIMAEVKPVSVPEDVPFPKTCPECGAGWSRRRYGWWGVGARDQYVMSVHCERLHACERQLSGSQRDRLLESIDPGFAERDARSQRGHDGERRPAWAMRDPFTATGSDIFDHIDGYFAASVAIEPSDEELEFIEAGLEQLPDDARLSIESRSEVRWQDDEGLIIAWRTGPSTREVVGCPYDSEAVLRFQFDDEKRSATAALFLDGDEIWRLPA